eukprot:scaffold127317_cov27-Phaeocystis_antarctica.AAC.1
MKGIAWLKKCLAHPSLLPLDMAHTITLLRSSNRLLERGTSRSRCCTSLAAKSSRGQVIIFDAPVDR